uniref:Uncharacterized protein n=2 Tax=Palpitomonas bilix TaxID=652834 RepID=A0A7S3DIB3_9EUKA|mmetsp:Transcript_39124/g.100198  ORF Transcript_39124/g.100198 Transcript_39124/m.100198 type:complete len:181 (+) Transcript_39124:411-953(+)
MEVANSALAIHDYKLFKVARLRPDIANSIACKEGLEGIVPGKGARRSQPGSFQMLDGLQYELETLDMNDVFGMFDTLGKQDTHRRSNERRDLDESAVPSSVRVPRTIIGIAGMVLPYYEDVQCSKREPEQASGDGLGQQASHIPRHHRHFGVQHEKKAKKREREERQSNTWRKNANAGLH